MKYKLYQVGGSVRDMIMGVKSKDIDYTVVCEGVNEGVSESVNPAWYFDQFVLQIKSEGYEVFLETPECFTVRAKFPSWHVHSGIADFVIARKEVYTPGSRTPQVEMGTLHDDLLRRDFTINAIALDEDGLFIDPFNGRQDISDNVLRTPTDVAVSFNDDPLRILRAVRFHITRGFNFSDQICNAIKTMDISDLQAVSSERVREELYKCFHFDTYRTIKVLNYLEDGLKFRIFVYLNDKQIWLKPTTEK